MHLENLLRKKQNHHQSLYSHSFLHDVIYWLLMPLCLHWSRHGRSIRGLYIIWTFFGIILHFVYDLVAWSFSLWLDGSELFVCTATWLPVSSPALRQRWWLHAPGRQLIATCLSLAQRQMVRFTYVVIFWLFEFVHAHRHFFWDFFPAHPQFLVRVFFPGCWILLPLTALKIYIYIFLLGAPFTPMACLIIISITIMTFPNQKPRIDRTVCDVSCDTSLYKDKWSKASCERGQTLVPQQVLDCTPLQTKKENVI